MNVLRTWGNLTENKMTKRKTKIAVAILMLYPIFLSAGQLGRPQGLKAEQSGDSYSVTASWNKNVEPDMHHYTVYRGTRSRGYSMIVRVNHPDTSVVIGGMIANVTYFFAVTASDTAGNESAFSDEVQFVINDTTVFNPGISDGFDYFDMGTWEFGTNAANISTIESGILALRSNAKEAGWVHTVNRFALRNCVMEVYFAKTGGSCDVGFSPTVRNESIDGILSEPDMIRVYIAYTSQDGRGIYLQEKKAGVVTANELLIADTRFKTSPVALRLTFSESSIDISYAFDNEFFPVLTRDLADIYRHGSYIELSSYYTISWEDAHVDSFALYRTAVEPNKFDLTKDGIVDIFDWIFLLRHIGTNSVSPDYKSDLDLNGDGWIDGMDKALFAKLSGFI